MLEELLIKIASLVFVRSGYDHEMFRTAENWTDQQELDELNAEIDELINEVISLTYGGC